MAKNTNRIPLPSPPSVGTREAGIKALKPKMPAPGYSEGGGGEAAGEPDKNIPGGNVGGTKSFGKSYLSDRDNVARPPAPPPYLSPNVPSSAQKDMPNVAKTFKSPQDRPGYNEEGNKADPSTNPSGFLTGEQYRAIPPSVPAPVKTYMGNNPTTDLKKGGPIKKSMKFWKGGDARQPREEWEPQKPEEKPGKGAGMFPLGGQSREEWEPQQNPGIQNNFPASTEDKDYPDILKPIEADTRTQKLKKGGPVKPGWRRW